MRDDLFADMPNADLFGDAPEPMVTASIFPHVGCNTVDVIEMPWSGWFAALCQPNIEPIKTGGKLLKLATFGDVRNPNEKQPDQSQWSLKHDDNVTTITGIEGDFDKGAMTIAEAKALLEKAGIRAIIYTSWSNGVIDPPKYNGGPRWRVLCPLSAPHRPGQRAALLARVNGVLGGALARESFNLSLGYFFGKNPSTEFHCEATFDDPKAGSCVDLLDELDNDAIGRDSAPTKGDENARPHTVIDENIFAVAVATKGGLLATGDNRRETLKSYIASRSRRGMRADDIGVCVAGIAAKYFDPNDPMDEANIAKLIMDTCNKDARALLANKPNASRANQRAARPEATMRAPTGSNQPGALANRLGNFR